MKHLSVEAKNKEAIDKLFDVINCMNNEKPLAKAFIEYLNHEHPTLQQAFFGVIREVIVAHGNRDRTDARNEASVEWAKRISKTDTHFGIPFPFI